MFDVLYITKPKSDKTLLLATAIEPNWWFCKLCPTDTASVDEMRRHLAGHILGGKKLDAK